jgi:hypothetical protein
MDVGKFLFKPKLVIYKFKSMEGCQFFNCCTKGGGYVVGKTNGGSKEKDFVTKEECYTLLKLYEELYAHPLTNGDYLTIFLRLVNAIEGMCCELGTICV